MFLFESTESRLFIVAFLSILWLKYEGLGCNLCCAITGKVYTCEQSAIISADVSKFFSKRVYLMSVIFLVNGLVYDSRVLSFYLRDL